MLLGFAIFDAEFTKRKLTEYGIEIELNPFTRFLCKRVGTAWGVDLSIYAPTGCWAIVGWYHPMLLAFIVGSRFTLFLLQRQGK
jgi:hypothetical protein